MSRVGRPAIGDAKMVSISIRVSAELYAKYKEQPKPSAAMREALTQYMLTKEQLGSTLKEKG